MKKAMKFQNLMTPRQAGELARLRVLSGPDSGSVFVVTASMARIGRDVSNDVVLGDLKASRSHAELVINSGQAQIRDIGSTSGIEINGKVMKDSQLKNGDRISIGETQFEVILTFDGSKGPQKTFIEKNRKMILALAGLMLISILLPQVENAQKKKKAEYVDPNEMLSERSGGLIEPPVQDPKAEKAAEGFFREGFREFRANNYNRAMVDFETALQIYPQHALANVYLASTKKAMADDAKKQFEEAQKDEEAYRIEEARSTYNAVKRLYGREPASEQYKEAQKRIEDLDKKLKEENH